MDKIKFTIGQILFLIFLLKLPALVFAGGGDGDGLSCETAFEATVNQQEIYTFNEEQESMFFEFTASNDSLSLIIQDSINMPFAIITEVEVYLFDDCNNLTSVYITTDSMRTNFIEMNNLNIESNYLIKLSRNPNTEMPESYFQMALTEMLIYPCPSEYDNECGELVKNGGFNHLTREPSPNYGGWNFGHGFAFHDDLVCEWTAIGPNYLSAGIRYRQNTSRIYAKISNNSGISTSVDVVPGSYVFSVDIKGIVADTTMPSTIPYEFRAILKNGSLNTETIIASIAESQIQKSSHPFNFTFDTKSFCFNVNQHYDELIIMTLSNHQYGFNDYFTFDNVSIRPYELDSASEFVTGACGNSNFIGPECVYPNASYSWSPTSGLSDPADPNPEFTSLSAKAAYILTMSMPDSSCPVLSSEVTVYNSFSIPDSTNISQLRSITGVSGNSLSEKALEINGTFFIDENFTFTDCNFYMGEDAKIIVDESMFNFASTGNNGANFIKSCDPDKFWDGIYVDGINDNAGINISGSIQDKLIISNAYNGIVAYNNPLEFLLNHITFDRNNRAVYYEGVENKDIFAYIADSEFRCSSPLVGSSGDYYPDEAVVIKNAKESGGYFTIGDGFLFNIFEGSGGSLKIENANVRVERAQFNGFNNQYFFPGQPTKSILAMEVKGSSSNPTLGVFNCYFLGCFGGINVNGQANIYIVDNHVNKNSSGIIQNGIQDSYFIHCSDVKNIYEGTWTTPYPNLNYIHNNDVYNVRKGIQLFNSPYFYVYDNTFDMEVQPDMNSYTDNYNEESIAIYANDYTVPSAGNIPPSDYLIVEGNTIIHSKVGIQTDFVWTSILSNTILDLNNRFTVPSSCIPIQNPCPVTPAYGIRVMNNFASVQENTVENDLSQYSGTMPNTQDKVIGISLENASLLEYFDLSLNCNKVENTGLGLRFAGYNGQAFIYKNRMKNNNIGFVLDNETYIGDVGGTDLILGQVEYAANEWVGTFGNSHTFNFSNSDPQTPPKYYKSSGSNLVISINDADPGYLSIQDTSISTPNTVSCTAPLLVDHSSGKKQATTSYNKSGRKAHWRLRGNSSDSAFYLRQQLQFYHLSKDSVLYNDPKWSTFRDSMRNTALGRALGKNSRSISSLSTPTNFDQNVSTVEPLLYKHFSDSTLSTSELDQLRQIALLCPFTDGIAVYQARRVLHEYGERLYVNTCETSQLPNNQRFIRIKAQEKVPFALYPNPANKQINISFSVKKDENVQVEFYDVLGKQVLTQSLKNGDLHEVNISQLQHGVYIYRLFKSQTQLHSGKIVIE